MRLTFTLLLSAFFFVANVLSAAHARADVALRPPPAQRSESSSEYSGLWKRRGGGGGGGGRGGGGSGGSSGGSSGGRSGSSSTSSSSTSSGGSSSAGSGSRGGSPGSSSGRASTSSNAGGRTTTGSGPAPQYGGGKYYGGGAAVPIKSGEPTKSGINPLLLGAGVGLAFWPGIWLSGAYLYPYHRPYTFYNASSRANETKPVTCGCDPYSVCGCDENDDPQYLSDIIGNGTNLNASLVSVAMVNGTQRILINGTLPNGTTAAGGDEDPFGNAAGGLQTLLRNAGWWPVVAIVSAIVFTA